MDISASAALEEEVEGLGAFAERTFLDGTLADWTSRTPQVVVPPGTIASKKAVAAALAAARARGGDIRAVPRGSVSSPGAAIFACVDGAPTTLERIAAAPVVEFDAEERELPELAGERLRVADAWVFHVEHWSDLLWANLLAMGPWLWAELATPWRLALSTLSARSVRPEAVAGGLVRRGADAWVHPHATVEFSVLGAGVRIGAGAVVRGSILGAGAIVEDLALVEGCVVGVGARIQRQAMAKYSVLEAGSAHAGVVQLGVLGAGAQVRQGAVLFDQSLGEPVRVLRRGVLSPSPRGMIGVCIGKNSIIAQGVRVAAGRAIPAGLVVLPAAGAVLSNPAVPVGTRRARVATGRLEPLS